MNKPKQKPSLEFSSLAKGMIPLSETTQNQLKGGFLSLSNDKLSLFSSENNNCTNTFECGHTENCNVCSNTGDCIGSQNSGVCTAIE